MVACAMRVEEGHYSSVAGDNSGRGATGARQVDSDPDRLIVEMQLPRVAAAEAFDHWTRPELVSRWWPAEAENDTRAGGWYHFAWPAQGWHLRGRYTVFEPGRALAFTWQWDHEPDRPMRHVAVDFTPLPDEAGSLVRVTHAVYGIDPADQAERESHRQGWRHFLGRLERVLSAGHATLDGRRREHGRSR